MEQNYSDFRMDLKHSCRFSKYFITIIIHLIMKVFSDLKKNNNKKPPKKPKQKSLKDKMLFILCFKRRRLHYTLFFHANVY